MMRLTNFRLEQLKRLVDTMLEEGVQYVDLEPDFEKNTIWVIRGPRREVEDIDIQADDIT